MNERRLPDFVVIGGRKCGTTWLDGLLRQHPQLHMPTRTKELFFFDRYWERGVGWYSEQFGEAKPDAIIGEVTPSYFQSIDAPGRLRNTLPHAQLVAVLRDPVERAWSDYRHALRKGDVRGTFEDAIEQMPSIINESRYAAAIDRWRYESKDKLLVLTFEDLISDTDSTLRHLVKHLGITEFERWELADQLNEAKLPRYRPLSLIAHRASRTAHRIGLHNLVAGLKKAGIGSVLESSADLRISPEQRLMVQNLLWDDFQKVRDLLPIGPGGSGTETWFMVC